MRRRSLALLGTAVATALAGCGGEDRRDPTEELVERLPALERALVTTVDLDRARDELGLDQAADPDVDDDASAEEKRLLGLARVALVYFDAPEEEAPVRSVLDGGQVTAAATTYVPRGSEALTVLATEQEFEEVADGLERHGYRRDGDVVTTNRAVVYPVVGGDDDGRVYLGSNRRIVDEAMRRDEAEDGLERARSLLEAVDGLAKLALTRQSACVTGMAMSDRGQKTSSGELVVESGDTAQETRFTADDDQFELARFDWEPPEIDGRRTTASYSVKDPLRFTGVDVASAYPVSMFYDCDEGVNTSHLKLARRLPAEGIRGIVAVDLHELRRTFFLDDYADPLALANSDNRSAQRFVGLAATALPHLSERGAGPLREAIDAGQITGAASAIAASPRPAPMTIAASEQDFAEVASGLEDAGWVREGAILRAGGAGRGLFRAVGGSGGLIYLGRSPAAIRAAMERERPEPAVERFRRPLRQYDPYAGIAFAPGGGCVRTMTVDDEAHEQSSGTVELRLDQESQASRFRPFGRLRGTRLDWGRPEAPGRRIYVTVKMSGKPDMNILALVGSRRPLYDCG